MIIGINGRIGAGKDTVGSIIKWLTSPKVRVYYNQDFDLYMTRGGTHSDNFYTKKFANKLKDMICVLIGCTKDQLEDQEFKNTPLGPEWDFKELFTDKRSITLDPDNKYPHIPFKQMTPRILLQLLGTDCGRNIIHPNVWVNALMSEYKADWGNPEIDQYPNWIITDMRFPNEYYAIRSKINFTIRVVRNMWYKEDELSHRWSDSENEEGNCVICAKTAYTKHSSWLQFLTTLGYNNAHESETALDSYHTDHTIYNNSSIEDLMEKVKEILIKERIL